MWSAKIFTGGHSSHYSVSCYTEPSPPPALSTPPYSWKLQNVGTMSVRPLRRLALSLTKYSIFGGGNSLRASFSSTSYCARLIRRSPTVKDLEWRRKAQLNQQPEPQATEEDYSYLWPVEIFDAAYKSGALSVPSWQAVQILNNFEALGPRPRKEAVKQLCSSMSTRSRSITH